MKAILFLVFLFLASSFVFAQNKNPLLNFSSWEIIGSKGFPSEKINLKKITKVDSSKNASTYTTYEFMRDGSLTETTHYPKNVGVCGNGLRYLKSGRWSYLKNTLIVELLYCGIDVETEVYKLEYKCKAAKGKATLVRSKVITEKKGGYNCSAN